MDREIFVQNIKLYCALKGVKPTVACRESGVGTSFIPDFKKGQTPSVAKVQMLAQYLGCTVSDLLGERSADMETGNIIAYADRNGDSKKTKRLSDAQYAALVKIIESLPEETDDL